MPFNSIYLQMNPYSDMAVSIKRQIVGNGTLVVDSPAKADVILQVVSDGREKEILSLSASGTVREYQLRQHFVFKLTDRAGLELIPLNDIYVYRDQSYNDAQLLAKEQEENQLYRDMQNDIAQQLLRRLAAAKITLPTADQSSAPVAASEPVAQ